MLFFLLVLLVLAAGLASAKGAGEFVAEGARRSTHLRNSATLQLACLPEGFALTDVIAYRQTETGKEKNLTLAEKLAELKAHCKKGKLMDGQGREIRFFQPACYGNPPENLDEIRQQEREALARLQKLYTVIIIECDPHSR